MGREITLLHLERVMLRYFFIRKRLSSVPKARVYGKIRYIKFNVDGRRISWKDWKKKRPYHRMPIPLCNWRKKQWAG